MLLKEVRRVELSKGFGGVPCGVCHLVDDNKVGTFCGTTASFEGKDYLIFYASKGKNASGKSIISIKREEVSFSVPPIEVLVIDLEQE